MAPLDEDDYSQAGSSSDYSQQQKKQLDHNGIGEQQPQADKGPVPSEPCQKTSGDQQNGEKDGVNGQQLLQLNVPLGSDGQGSHDSHNDSGYSTRMGFSAGPSPSLSGIVELYVKIEQGLLNY